ncbi:hypothetical protein KBD75_00970 [Candidatus Woesebacteria bacterium]|nr:hypothetical protein [Candidatus Woesebacteria bacterium]
MNKLLSSVQFVVDNSDHVSINHEAIGTFVANFKPTQVDHWMKACPFEYRPLKNIEDEIDRWFLADAQAFCFWGYPTKWNINYEGKQTDGWWGLLAAIQKTIEAGVPLLEGDYLANMSVEQIKELFAGEPTIPLLSERLTAFRQIGQTLVTKYQGRFHNFLTSAPKDAPELTLALAAEFEIFRDTASYKGETIHFYKKAQLLVHDLKEGFPGTKYSQIENISDLTGEADYKVPAILRKMEILVYDIELAKKVDNRIELTSGSAEEVEVRAGMLVALNVMVEKLKPAYPQMNALTLDGILWVMSQTKSGDDKPYHLTLTVDY